MNTTTTTHMVTLALALGAWLLPQIGRCFYNPSTGRWLSRDPVEEDGFNEMSLDIAVVAEGTEAANALNVYSFVGNRPPGAVDPFGLWETYGKLRCAKRCYPCTPPAGTTMYRTDTVPPSRLHKPFKGTHTHHYVVHQSPVTAKKPCFCEPKETSVTGGGTSAVGEIKEQKVGGGGVQYFYLVDEE